MDSILTPSFECTTCEHLIHADEDSFTGATATRPCELWAENEPHGFCLEISNKGSCEIYVFLRRFDEDYPRAGTPLALTNMDGSVVIDEKGHPVQAIPYDPAFKFRSGIEFDRFVVDIERRICGIGILCVRTDNNVCPICEADIALSLSCGETLVYKMVPPLIESSSSRLTITGTIECTDLATTTTTTTTAAATDTDIINPRNLRAQLICCKFGRSGRIGNAAAKVVETVPITVTDASSNTGSYTFDNVSIDCFRIDIVCTTAGSASTTSIARTGAGGGIGVTEANRGILGSSECQLVNGNTRIMVEPIVIDCTTCVDRMVTITGQAVCSTTLSTAGAAITDVTVQIIRCEKKSTAVCGASGSLACGSPLLVTPTFSEELGTDGKFSASVPEDCYFVRFVCTSAPTTVIYPAAGVTPICQFFCKTTTNLGVITIPCTCPKEQVTIVGTVVCSTTTTTIPADTITAQLVQCMTSAASTAAGLCGTITVPPTQVIVATDTVDTMGRYDFGAVDSGCYAIQFVCTSCSIEGTVIGTIPCTLYTGENTVNPVAPFTIDCSTCGTVSVTGTVICTTGLPTATELIVTTYGDGCGTTTSNTTQAIVPDSKGNYSFCVTPGVGITILTLCRDTSAVLAPATACETILNDTVIDITIADCTCAVAVVAAADDDNVEDNTTVVTVVDNSNNSAISKVTKSKKPLAMTSAVANKSRVVPPHSQKTSSSQKTAPSKKSVATTTTKSKVGRIAGAGIGTTIEKSLNLSGTVETKFDVSGVVIEIVSSTGNIISSSMIIDDNWSVDIPPGNYQIVIRDKASNSMLATYKLGNYTEDQHFTIII